MRALPTHSTGMLTGVSEPTLDFSDVYDAHIDFVWSMLRRLGVSLGHLDDAAQDVFVVVHRQLRVFRGASTVKTWVGGIAVRTAQAYRRRAHRDAQSEPWEQHAAVPATEKDPHQAAEDAQAWAQLERLLETLDDDQRTVFVLSELEEISAPEIASIVGVPVNTVYSRLRLGRAKLRAALAGARGEMR